MAPASKFLSFASIAIGPYGLAFGQDWEELPSPPQQPPKWADQAVLLMIEVEPTDMMPPSPNPATVSVATCHNSGVAFEASANRLRPSAAKPHPDRQRKRGRAARNCHHG
jgi:hypothetical protein